MEQNIEKQTKMSLDILPRKRVFIERKIIKWRQRETKRMKIVLVGMTLSFCQVLI